MIQISDIPFNMDYSILDNLRDEPEDFEEMKKGIDFLEQKLEEAEGEVVRGKILSLLGVFSRMTWQLDRSEVFLSESVKIFKEKKIMPLMLVSKIRLGHTYHWMEKFTQADDIFNKALEITRKSKDPKIKMYEDFALQHLAKSLFDQNRHRDALDTFLECLELRLIKGDLNLIDSTQKAISICRMKLEGD